VFLGKKVAGIYFLQIVMTKFDYFLDCQKKRKKISGRENNKKFLVQKRIFKNYVEY